jgi:hypothetical protein
MTLLCQWIVAAWQHISPEAVLKGLKSAVYEIQWLRLMVTCSLMTVKRS